MAWPNDSKAMVKGIFIVTTVVVVTALVTGCDSESGTPAATTSVVDGGSVPSEEVLVQPRAVEAAPTGTRVVPSTTAVPQGKDVKRDDRRRPGVETQAVTTPKPSPKKASPTTTKKAPSSKVEDKKSSSVSKPVMTGPDGSTFTDIPCPIGYDEQSRPVYKC